MTDETARKGLPQCEGITMPGSRFQDRCMNPAWLRTKSGMKVCGLHSQTQDRQDDPTVARLDGGNLDA